RGRRRAPGAQPPGPDEPVTAQRSYSRPDQQAEAGGEAVQERPLTDWANLAVAEQTGQRERSQTFGNGGGIVVGHVEQTHAAAVAGAQDRGNWRVVTQPCARVVEQRPQILVGRGGVADLELDGLADSWPGPNSQRSGVLVDSQQVANEEAAAVERVLVLIGGQADQQIALGSPLDIGGQAAERVDEQLVSRTIRDGFHRVPLGGGDRPRLAD